MKFENEGKKTLRSLTPWLFHTFSHAFRVLVGVGPLLPLLLDGPVAATPCDGGVHESSPFLQRRGGTPVAALAGTPRAAELLDVVLAGRENDGAAAPLLESAAALGVALAGRENDGAAAPLLESPAALGAALAGREYGPLRALCGVVMRTS